MLYYKNKTGANAAPVTKILKSLGLLFYRRLIRYGLGSKVDVTAASIVEVGATTGIMLVCKTSPF